MRQVARFIGRILLVVAALTACACGGGSSNQPGIADFGIEVSPASASVQRGDSVAVTVLVTRFHGWNGTADVALADPATGITAGALTIAQAATQGVLTVRVGANAAPGERMVPVVATSNGSTRLAVLSLTVTGSSTAPGFTLAVAPATVQQSAGHVVPVTIARATGFTAAVDVTIASAPTGVTALPLNIPAGASQGVLTLTTTSATPVGSASVQLVGSGGGQTASATLTLNVTAGSAAPGFAIAADQPWMRVPKGGSGSVIVTVTREAGFTGAVSLSATGLPPDVTVPGVTIQAGANSALLTFDATAGALQRDVDVTVTGTSGLTTRTTTLEVLVPGAPGELDLTFGGSGKVTVAVSGSDYGRAVAVQPDGKILLAGNARSSSTLADFALLRLGRNGALDSSFGTAGTVQTPLSTRDDNAWALAIQPDGKVVLAGFATDPATSAKSLALARYDSSGALDATFGQGGKVTTPLDAGSADLYGVALQPDGKIVAVGKAVFGGPASIVVVRYGASGALDDTFGNGGAVLATFDETTSSWAEAVAMSGDKVVVAGRAGGMFAVLRLTATGAFDTTFASIGGATISFGFSDDFGYALAVPDGRPVVVGRARVGSDTAFAVARFGVDGTLDATFNGTGLTVTQISSAGAGVESEAYGVAVQADGKVVAAGAAEASDGLLDFALVRYSADGTLDAGFGSGGKVTTNMSTTSTHRQSVANGVTLTRDGRIVLGGDVFGTFAVARYWP